MIYVLLPAYNEESGLPRLLETFRQLFAVHQLEYRVVVVDAGSSDNTAVIATRYAEHMPLDLLRHDVNKGLGAAMRTGFQHLAKVCTAQDHVVTMDADNPHNPTTLLTMREAIAAGADIVIASRYATGGQEVGLKTYRRFLSRGASLLLTIFFPITGVTDYTCGYRMYRAPLIRQLIERYSEAFIVENGFVCMAEILIKMAYLPARITEVPLILRYDLKENPSKMKVCRTILCYVSLILREKLHRQR